MEEKEKREGLEPESSWEGTGLGKGEKGWEEPAKGFGFTRGSCWLPPLPATSQM